MRNKIFKKDKIALLLITVSLLIAVTAGCARIDYGKNFTNMEGLKEFVSTLSLDKIKYPSYFGEETAKSYYEYVCSKDGTKEGYSCYKIYHFSEKYAYSVYLYFDETEEFSLKSDMRAEFKEKITLNDCEVSVNLGKISNTEQFVIFGLIIDGRQVEIRISSRHKDTKILYDNDNYKFALAEVENIISSIQ